MAIYHCSIKNISRTNGKSSVAAAAYRSGEKLKDERQDKTFSYRKSEVAYSEILLPQNAPSEYADRSTLWNAVEKVEKQSNARLAREWELAIPNELNLERAKILTREFAQSLADEGMCVDLNIHWKSGNHHAHILGTTRPIKKNGEWGDKEKKGYALDENGNKIPVIDEQTGKQKIGARGRKIWKRQTIEANDWNKQEKVKEWRERWEEMANKALENAGYDERIDHRSHEEQEKEEIPTIHEGYAAREMEKRGQISERCEINRNIRQINKNLQAIKKDYLELEKEEKRLIIEQEKQINVEKENVAWEKLLADADKQTREFKHNTINDLYSMPTDYAAYALLSAKYFLPKIEQQEKIKVLRCLNVLKKNIHHKLQKVKNYDEYQAGQKRLEYATNFDDKLKAVAQAELLVTYAQHLKSLYFEEQKIIEQCHIQQQLIESLTKQVEAKVENAYKSLLPNIRSEYERNNSLLKLKSEALQKEIAQEQVTYKEYKRKLQQSGLADRLSGRKSEWQKGTIASRDRIKSLSAERDNIQQQMEKAEKQYQKQAKSLLESTHKAIMQEDIGQMLKIVKEVNLPACAKEVRGEIEFVENRMDSIAKNVPIASSLPKQAKAVAYKQANKPAPIPVPQNKQEAASVQANFSQARAMAMSRAAASASARSAAVSSLRSLLSGLSSSKGSSAAGAGDLGSAMVANSRRLEIEEAIEALMNGEELTIGQEVALGRFE